MRVESKIFRMDQSFIQNGNSERKATLLSPQEWQYSLILSESNGLVSNGCWNKCKREERNSPICSQREASVIRGPVRGEGKGL